MSSALTARSEARPDLDALRAAVGRALEGKPDAVELGLTALLAKGHLLIEDVPGVGKTTLARAIAKAVGGELARIQFTSDLLPGDVLGVSVFDQPRNEFVFKQGPIFANMVLADEINRASPRTQSALLEAMNEGQVSAEGESIPLPDPFFVIATQNPLDYAGTYPLPESQLDRFMVRLRIGYPPSQVEHRLVMRPDADRVRDVPQVLDPARLVTLQREVERVRLDPSLAHYLQAVISATRTSPAVAIGASPRAGMNLSRAARARAMLRGREFCIADDIHDLTVPVLAHRVRLAAQADGYVPCYDEAEATIRDLVARIPIPL
ncbi:MAG: MoxR family ATPase [Deltaproteobacteria bacterium]|nr:MoxR family ATPase [Deltaproteobacteria bacterium]